jgi:hypothetical protein
LFTLRELFSQGIDTSTQLPLYALRELLRHSMLRRQYFLIDEDPPVR